VVYPEIYDPSSYNTTTYATSNNLLPMLQIYDNGTLISVGTRDKLMDVQIDDVDRVIWKLIIEGNITGRMQEFYSIVNQSGFFIQQNYEQNKSNKICDTFYSGHFNHEVCVLKGETTQVFEEIRSAIRRIFLTTYTSWEYFPNEFYVTTVNLPRYVDYKKVNQTTRISIVREFDPDEIYFKGNYYYTNCWVHTSLFGSVSPFIDAVNKHRIYDDSYTAIRFITWIPELSLSNVPPVSRTTTYWYSTTHWIEPVDSNSSGPSEFLIISICLVVILLFSLCVAIIIRRAKMRKTNQTDNSDLYDNYLSDSEVLSNEMDHTPQPVQTSYPIFVTNNQMQGNPQPYPIFVTTNPMLTNPMPTNPQMTNPIVFPQPTLFYPQTNQN
jgi:hypothetical protein